jgi:aspartate/methionine/tyrosine aminotransferase
MEDWLNDSFDVEYNLSSSGCQDYKLGEFLDLCGADRAALDDLFLGDNDTRGSLALRGAILESYETIDLDNVLVTNGTSEALFCLLNQILGPGDEVILPFPAFQCLYQIPVSIGCNVRFINLLESKAWRLDIDALEDMVSPRTKLIIINTPHNPLGWTLSAQEMARLGSIAARNDAYLLFDEHYRYLPLAPGTELIPSGYDICRKNWPKTYATGSMIKCFGIVGIRIGWLLGDREMLNQCRDYKDYLTHTIPMLTDHVALLALRNKEQIIRLKKQDILANLSALNQFMDRQQDALEYLPPTGGVVCFPRLTLAPDSRDFCQTLLEKHGVSILPGFSFEADQHLRINIGIAASRFKEALQRIEECLHDYRRSNHG